ncbi:hypothetical protein [Oribacterium sp. WCC10]|uniref:hypothetical protein n=1 Tax=Oribacterium sp. WCC10 TaxID=1855343 RepID=UPI0008EDD737|nr:hypothetical protein [Oribacterium sp. WCC10]SFG55913.1 hypothetical protein SAMN05216356_1135 [Oribacterium sp. WCC10]
MKIKKRIVTGTALALTALALCSCGSSQTPEATTVAKAESENAETTAAETTAAVKETESSLVVYESKDGWSVKYDKDHFTVNEGNGLTNFVYTGESSGSDLVEISYIKDKQPEEVLGEITESWGDPDKVSIFESFFPGTSDKWGYWRTLDGTDTGSGLNETVIAGEYNGGVLLFDITTHVEKGEDTSVSDYISDIINSISYDDFKPQTMYEYVPGKYTMTYEDELDGNKVSCEYSVTLNEDHTGILSIQDDIEVLWGSSEFIPTSGGDKIEYTIEGDNLMLNQDGEWITFTKES